MTETTMKITGMTCGNCVRHAREALEAVPGVVDAEVTLEPGRAKVRHAEETAVDALVHAVEEEGYQAQVEQ
jgi:copper chaperone